MALTEVYASAAGAGAHDGTSEANAFSWAEMITDINAGGKAGNRYNYKGAIARTTTTDTISGGGTVTSPVIIRGYASVIGDGYQGRTNDNGPLVTTNMPAITYTTGRLNISGTFVLVESLNLSGNPSQPLLTVGTDSVIRGCKVVNSSTNAAAAGVTPGARGFVVDNDIALTGASGGTGAVSVGAAANVTLLGNRINGGPAAGVTATTGAPVALMNLIFSSTGNHLQNTNTSGLIRGFFNTLVGGGADAVNVLTGTTVLNAMWGNMITDNGAYGVNMVSTSNAAVLGATRFRDNTSGNVGNGGDWITATNWGNVTTDTGGPETDYVDESTDDYNLIEASPATSAAVPAYASMGALQREQAGGGGGGLLRNPGMNANLV